MSSTEIAPPRAADSTKARPRPAKRPPRPPAVLSDADIRKFGIVMIVGFGLIGGFLAWRGYVTAPRVLWAFGGALGLLALAAPGPARPVHKVWMGFAHVLGRINTTILLSVFYYLVVTPLALIFKLIGRDALHRRFDPSAASYWEPKAMRTDARSYFDPF